MKEVEGRVLRCSWDREVVDKIALILVISCQIVDVIKTVLFFFLTCKALLMKIDAFHYIQLGTVYRWVKLLSLCNNNTCSYFLSLLTAFISVQLGVLPGAVPWWAQARMSIAALLEWVLFAPLCVYRDVYTSTAWPSTADSPVQPWENWQAGWSHSADSLCFRLLNCAERHLKIPWWLLCCCFLCK